MVMAKKISERGLLRQDIQHSVNFLAKSTSSCTVISQKVFISYSTQNKKNCREIKLFFHQFKAFFTRTFSFDVWICPPSQHKFLVETNEYRMYTLWSSQLDWISMSFADKESHSWERHKLSESVSGSRLLHTWAL